MAVTLDSYDFTTDPTPPPSRGARRYPWGDWFDGRIWRISQGEDFLLDQHIMERTIRSRASDKHLLVSIRHEVDAEGVPSLIFRAVPKEGAERPQEVVEEAPAPLVAEEVQEAPVTPSEDVSHEAAPEADFGDVVEHRIVRPKLPV